jgi:Right handed beta helix region
MFRLVAVGQLIFILVCGGLSTVAAGTTQRTFVAHDGVDNPACSLAAPCRGFAAALAATSANGEVIVLDSAGYGTMTITKAVSIIAPAGIYAGISVTSGDGVTVNAGASDKVVLRGLTINGQGGSNGIVFLQGGELNIEDCTVANLGADGLVVSAANSNVIVKNSIFRDNAASGVSVLGGSIRATFDGIQLTNNGANGLYVLNFATAVITASIISGNLVGINGDGPAISITTIVSSHNKISRNGTGIKADAIMGLVYALLDNNLLTLNTTAVYMAAYSSGITFGNNVYANNGADGLGLPLLVQSPK